MFESHKYHTLYGGRSAQGPRGQGSHPWLNKSGQFGGYQFLFVVVKSNRAGMCDEPVVTPVPTLTPPPPPPSPQGSPSLPSSIHDCLNYKLKAKVKMINHFRNGPRGPSQSRSERLGSLGSPASQGVVDLPPADDIAARPAQPGPLSPARSPRGGARSALHTFPCFVSGEPC